MIYLSELKKWNRVYNLTGLRTDEDIIIKHFLDSVLYLNFLPAKRITVADIGSGAGFPGIPMKMVRPEINMYLIEPSAKKSSFLNHLIRTMNLDAIMVIEKRVEEAMTPGDIIPVDAAVSRALFSVKDFVRKTSHMVKPGGRLVLSKGPKVSGELKMMNNAEVEIIMRRLPLSDIKRFFVVITL
ncbi:MAG: 16S rRNA (guanine(527)-N(7))-methyltransferase RsmG [Thermodesulfovibrionales bacterium]|nr:16S rRNA (guanine(527)-N(7))-methyltransferase RsmG [Thermodesulfovibrionales bacterium]